jgi:hypothetical protein
MRILFVVDGRSPIALNWMRYFSEEQHEVHEVHLVSTFPCEPELKLASFHVLSVAFSELGERGKGVRGGGVRGLLRKAIPVGVRTGFKQWLGPLTLPRAAGELRELVDQIRPDLVHAMRIPYEGTLAALAMGVAGWVDKMRRDGEWQHIGSAANRRIHRSVSTWRTPVRPYWCRWGNDLFTCSRAKWPALPLTYFAQSPAHRLPEGLLPGP